MTRAGQLLEAAKPSIKNLIKQSGIKVFVKNFTKLTDAVNFGAADSYYTNDYKYFIELRPTFISIIELDDLFKAGADCKGYMLKLKRDSISKNNNKDAVLLREEVAKLVESGELVTIKDVTKAKDYQAFGDHLEVSKDVIESEELLAELKHDLGLAPAPQY